MTTNEKWNIIVSQCKGHYNENEATVQKVWERIFAELFGYSSFCGEIDCQRSLKIGSKERVIPDIILRNDREDLVDIELKQLSAPFDTRMEEQMISYLKLLNLSIGVLVCKKLYLYHFDYSTSKTQKVSIDFTKDNPDGIRFVEMLQKTSFSKEAIKDFVRTKNVFSENVGLIRDELSSTFLKQLVVKHFEKSFTNDEIDAALSGYVFACDFEGKEPAPAPKVVNLRPVREDKPIKAIKTIENDHGISEAQKIRNVIAQLGGVARLSDIYKKYFEIYGCEGKDKEAVIRGTIYVNTSDSEMWDKPTCSGNDMFYHAGKGRWGNR